MAEISRLHFNTEEAAVYAFGVAFFIVNSRHVSAAVSNYTRNVLELTWLVDKIGGRFNVTGIAIINKVIGSVVILFSVIILFGTVFNLYHLPSY